MLNTCMGTPAMLQAPPSLAPPPLPAAAELSPPPLPAEAENGLNGSRPADDTWGTHGTIAPPGGAAGGGAAVLLELGGRTQSGCAWLSSTCHSSGVTSMSNTSRSSPAAHSRSIIMRARCDGTGGTCSKARAYQNAMHFA